MKRTEFTPSVDRARLPRLVYWAQSAPTKTRWLIVGLHMLIGAFATLAGWILGDLGATPISKWLAIPLILGLIAIFFYPFGKTAMTWRRRKILDATLVLAAITIWIGAGIRIHWATHEGQSAVSSIQLGSQAFASRVPEANPETSPGGTQERIRPHGMPETSGYPQSPAQDLATPQAIDASRGAVAPEEQASASPQLQSATNSTKATDATTKPQGKAIESMGVKILLFVLAILAAFVLGYFVAILGCYIVCSGVPVLGYAVWALGWIGLLVGLFLLGRYFFRSRNTNSKVVKPRQRLPLAPE